MSDNTTEPEAVEAEATTTEPDVRADAEKLPTPAFPNGYRLEARPEGGRPDAPLFYVLIDKKNTERQEQLHGQTQDDVNALHERYRQLPELDESERVK